MVSGSDVASDILFWSVLCQHRSWMMQCLSPSSGEGDLTQLMPPWHAACLCLLTTTDKEPGGPWSSHDGSQATWMLAPPASTTPYFHVCRRLLGVSGDLPFPHLRAPSPVPSFSAAFTTVAPHAPTCPYTHPHPSVTPRGLQRAGQPGETTLDSPEGLRTAPMGYFILQVESFVPCSHWLCGVLAFLPVALKLPLEKCRVLFQPTTGSCTAGRESVAV